MARDDPGYKASFLFQAALCKKPASSANYTRVCQLRDVGFARWDWRSARCARGGYVTVLGIAARNGVMLVSHFLHLEREEAMAFGPELVLRGVGERLAPIAMTALATGLALVPLIMGGARPGQELEMPMAVVILGGLVSSTLLNVFAVPCGYLLLRLRERTETRVL